MKAWYSIADDRAAGFWSAVWKKCTVNQTNKSGLGVIILHRIYFFPKTFNLFILDHGSKNIIGNKITSRCMDHLMTTTVTGASRRRVAVISPSSREPLKLCYSGQSESCHAKVSWDQHTRATTIADEESRRSKGSDLQTPKRIWTKNGSKQIHRRSDGLNTAKSDGYTPPHALQRC